ncbi:galactose mutarotase isoform X2 [Dendroctonus ponderosae]|uniref:galactose mutarotase isoform X2 n=1 Tax=Dendroctonus ponderosae TaxID=77166 RepID=UPI002035308F|nr:galactose mutarotase isoform X2 [Dendroctonus ponderosae]
MFSKKPRNFDLKAAVEWNQCVTERGCERFRFGANIQTTMAKYAQKEGVELDEDEFDTYTEPSTGQLLSVRRFTWRTTSGVSVQVITYGATITSIKMPDRNGTIDDIVMGFDDMKGYLQPLNPYFGATVGRVANRIGSATITIDDQTYHLTPNLAPHMLHGGAKGFDKVNWSHHVNGTDVVLSCLSRDLEEGFPGDVITTVTYRLTNENRLEVELRSTSTRPTFVNLTNHSYFNLAGHATGSSALYQHLLAINADQTTDVDKDSIPTGKLLPVAGTVFDLRIPHPLGAVIDKVPHYEGFDHNFCITKGTGQGGAFVARAEHPGTGRALEVYSNQPGVQFYTSNHIQSGTLSGKGGASYGKHGAFCLETQNYPDAVNHANFPPAVLYPGQVYLHLVEYRLSVD